MKKKLYLGLLLTVSFAAVTFFVANMGSETNSLLRANIEALANDESGEGLGEGEGQIGYFPCIKDEVSYCVFIARDASGMLHEMKVYGYRKSSNA